MDGIGGMVIGNMFKINDDILPAGYKGTTPKSNVGSKIGYVVTGLGHKVSNNDWTTQVDAQFVILDEPTGTPGKPLVTAINRRVTSVSGGLGGGGTCPDVTRRTGKWASLVYEPYVQTTVSISDMVNYLNTKTSYLRSIRRATYAIFANESGRGVKGINNNFGGVQTDGGGFISTDLNYVKGTTSRIDGSGRCRAFATYDTWQKWVDHMLEIMKSRLEGGTSSRPMVPLNEANAAYFGNGYAVNWVAPTIPFTSPPILDVAKVAVETAKGISLYNEAITKGL